MSSKHSPLLKVSRFSDSTRTAIELVADNENVLTTVGGTHPQIVKRLITSYNSHDELVEALKLAENQIRHFDMCSKRYSHLCDCGADGTLKVVREALAGLGEK